jgi:diguanylate cyclase (GGDEF)-like protein/PAS domain S-box-containing protein
MTTRPHPRERATGDTGQGAVPGVVDLGRLQLLARATEQVAEGVAVFDNDDVVIYANPVLERMHGVATGDLEGRHLSALIPNAGEATAQRSRDDAAGVDVTRMELTVPTAINRDRTVQVAVSLLRDGAGAPIGRIVSVLDISDRKALEGRLQQAALHDPLTGLPNRLLLLDRLEQALADSRRKKRAIAVLFIDLDGFKLVNDTHGHAAGDQLLRQTAQRLSDCTRAGDTVARIGGDEFVALLVGMNGEEDMTATTTRMRDRLSEPFTLDDVTVSVTASIGATVTTVGRPKDILHAADTAMYKAKMSGPGQIATSDVVDKGWTP